MSQVTELPEFLTVEETARLLRLHPRTIRNRINAGLLPAKLIIGGKSRLIAKADALAILKDVRPVQSAGVSETPWAEAEPVPAKPTSATDRLSTPEGRVRAVEMLQRLLALDIDEQATVEQESLPLVSEPVSLRRWNVETWERLDESE